MKALLTKEDNKSLRYECRAGILFAIGIFFLGLLIVYIGFVVGSADSSQYHYINSITAIILLLIVSAVLGLLFIRKYVLDLKNKEKDLTRYTIQKKESKLDYEVGSANLFIGQKMKAFDKYNLTINNSIHTVDKELFEKATEGDEVYLHTAPISGHLLKIELIK